VRLRGSRVRRCGKWTCVESTPGFPTFSSAGAAVPPRHPSMPSPDETRARFRDLHARQQLFVMPNPWDVGSARLLEAAGFEALATTSAGFAWTLGRRDQEVTRDELVRHVAALAAAISVPLNVDSERCFPDEPGGVAETTRQLADAGASGLSVEDYDPAGDRIEDLHTAVDRVAAVAEAARGLSSPMVVTGRAENHLHGVDDLDDTIGRLVAYRDAGADVVYAPGLTDIDRIRRVVEEVQVPVNVLALPSGPRVPELEAVGVRRVSTGGALARAAYGAALAGADELRTTGTARYAAEAPTTASIQTALGSGTPPR
jgi:2-methylisocitrate lyase-like PEP mutase family enzyme